ncbi:MAG: enoyl-CoA hydratase-related protein [Chloroflexota bacterium]
MGNTVIYHVQDRIATITLNRPEALNAINRELRADLDDALRRFDQDNEAWVGIITGAGRAFCAGRDLKERTEDNAAGRQARGMDSMSPDTLFMWSPPRKPLIAAINGYALAGGWSIAQMCDLRIASESAMLGITEPRVGLMPPFAVQLNRIIPETAVMELVLTAEPIPARRVMEMGFLNRVVPADQVLEAARAMAQTVLRNAPLSVRAFKELVARCRSLPEQEAVEATEEVYDRLLLSQDSKEGPLAFAEKRPPRWQAA